MNFIAFLLCPILSLFARAIFALCTFIRKKADNIVGFFCDLFFSLVAFSPLFILLYPIMLGDYTPYIPLFYALTFYLWWKIIKKKNPT
ncbi:MAG: hypothetical protein IJY70_00315 [Clostridia bacterium]|nr:hypothetical protein [Clostridia bacterium]